MDPVEEHAGPGALRAHDGQAHAEAFAHRERVGEVPLGVVPAAEAGGERLAVISALRRDGSSASGYRARSATKPFGCFSRWKDSRAEPSTRPPPSDSTRSKATLAYGPSVRMVSFLIET